MGKVDEYLQKVEKLELDLHPFACFSDEDGLRLRSVLSEVHSLRKAIQALQRKCSAYSVRSVPVLSADDIERILERELIGSEE